MRSGRIRVCWTLYGCTTLRQQRRRPRRASRFSTKLKHCARRALRTDHTDRSGPPAPAQLSTGSGCTSRAARGGIIHGGGLASCCVTCSLVKAAWWRCKQVLVCIKCTAMIYGWSAHILKGTPKRNYRLLWLRHWCAVYVSSGVITVCSFFPELYLYDTITRTDTSGNSLLMYVGMSDYSPYCIQLPQPDTDIVEHPHIRYVK